MLSRTELHSDDKWYVEAYKIYLNLLWQYGEVGFGAGDVAGGAEYRPTDASVAVLEMLEKEIATANARIHQDRRNGVAGIQQSHGGKTRRRSRTGKSTCSMGWVQTLTPRLVETHNGDIQRRRGVSHDAVGRGQRFSLDLFRNGKVKSIQGPEGDSRQHG